MHVILWVINRGVQNVKNIELKLAKQFFSLPWSILMTTKNFSSLGQREDPALAHEDFTIWAHKVENDKTKKWA